jgi:hypothetical protein
MSGYTQNVRQVTVNFRPMSLGSIINVGGNIFNLRAAVGARQESRL